ncbi:MAG: tetratricopeptide repeat protein [Bacteroidota bacterium]
MYKLTKNGKTIVGNNEDYFSPNSQFWFEEGRKDTFGVMYMGLLNNFPQGAFNEAGLMYDGFYEPYLAVNETEGKLDIPIEEALKIVMQTMTYVEEVQAYLSTINLSFITNGQLVFVDKSGTYLIIEGDEMIVGDEPEKTFSNFYYSQITSVDEVNLEYYQNGRKFLASTTEKETLDYCSEAMSHFAQANIAHTQYSTIYDLNELKVRVHLLHDFEQYVELDLKQEFTKGNHRTMIAELFPKESAGYQFYETYNNPDHPSKWIEEYLKGQEFTEEDLTNSGFDMVINQLGYEWLNYKQDAEGAIKMFSYGIELMPNNANLYDSLGEAYFQHKDWKNSLKHYRKSLELNPENENAVKMVEKIRELEKTDSGK